MSSAQEVVLYKTTLGARTAIVSEGRKKLSAVVLDIPVRVLRLPKSERRYMRPLDYPLAKAKKHYRAAGRRLGVQKSARRLLRERPER